MKKQQTENYKKIARAIEFIRMHRGEHLLFEQITASVNLSPYHFQCLINEWAGVDSEKFLQYIRPEYAQTALKKNKYCFTTTKQIPKSETEQPYRIIHIEKMESEQFHNGSENLLIHYEFLDSIFGEILAASTDKGICFWAFCDKRNTPFNELKQLYPNARYRQTETSAHQEALSWFLREEKAPKKIGLHLKGTDFQIEVWKTLLKIPQGQLTTYKAVAETIGKPAACRAVGTAIGNNPVSLLIPCHRVIRGSGELGGYHWGLERKIALIGWEAIKTQDKTNP